MNQVLGFTVSIQRLTAQQLPMITFLPLATQYRHYYIPLGGLEQQDCLPLLDKAPSQDIPMCSTQNKCN